MSIKKEWVMWIWNTLFINRIIVWGIILLFAILPPVFAQDAQKSGNGMDLKEVDLAACIQQAMEKQPPSPGFPVMP